MLAVFHYQNKILFTYPDVILHTGDSIRKQNEKYVVMQTCFDVDSGAYIYFLEKLPNEVSDSNMCSL